MSLNALLNSSIFAESIIRIVCRFVSVSVTFASDPSPMNYLAKVFIASVLTVLKDLIDFKDLIEEQLT